MAPESQPALRYSIVLCTRNPRSDYLARVLAAIGSLADTAKRELVVVDSASTPPLGDRDIPWPRNTRIVRLAEPGIARARAAGVRAAWGIWIVFVDDDNVLDTDYLERADEVIAKYPDIALFCGRISGEFEQPPPDWLKRYYRQLAIIEIRRDTTATAWIPDNIPCWTAGMCVRRDIALDFCNHIASDPFALEISTRVEDVYLIMHTVGNGHMAGLFRALHLRHLIPPERMTVAYLRKIVTETAYNMTVLRCRESGASFRDILRPLKNAATATLGHGWSRDGQIARAAAIADIRGALACAWPRPRDTG